MSEPDLTEAVDPAPSGRVRASDAILIALGETRAAAKQAADTAVRVENAVGGLAQRVGRLEVDVASMQTQLAERDRADAAMRQVETQQEVTKTPAATWIALVVAVAAVLIPLLLDAYHSSGSTTP